MFNWTTTTILNSLQDIDGNDLVKVWTEGLTKAAGGPAGFSGSYPILKINKDHTFEARYVTSFYKTVANDPKLCKLAIDCAKLKTKVNALVDDAKDYPVHCRLSFYITLEGSEESIYANSGYQKGKQFSVGFDVKSSTVSPADIMDTIIKNVTKYGAAMYGRKVFEFEKGTAAGSNANTLFLKGTHEYQRFNKATVTIDDGIDEVIVDVFEFPETPDSSSIFKVEERGENGFGTYNYILKNLRLPTAQNTRWLAMNEAERPAVGAKYNQYIISYCAPSMANPGLTVIGQHNMSVTTHVFWVNQAIDADFEAALAGFVTPEVPTATKVAGKDYSLNHEQKIVDVEKEEKTTSTDPSALGD